MCGCGHRPTSRKDGCSSFFHTLCDPSPWCDSMHVLGCHNSSTVRFQALRHIQWTCVNIPSMHSAESAMTLQPQISKTTTEIGFLFQKKLVELGAIRVCLDRFELFFGFESTFCQVAVAARRNRRLPFFAPPCSSPLPPSHPAFPIVLHPCLLAIAAICRKSALCSVLFLDRFVDIRGRFY